MSIATKCELYGGPQDGQLRVIPDSYNEIHFAVPRYPASVFKEIDLNDPINYNTPHYTYRRSGKSSFVFEGLEGKISTGS